MVYPNSGRSRRLRLGVLSAIVGASLGIAACGSSSTSSTSSNGGGSTTSSSASATTTSGSASASLAKFQTLSADAQKPWTTFGATKAFKAPKHENLAIVVCGSTIGGCLEPGEAAKQAAEALGWKVTLYDGKADPTVQNQVIEQAVNSGATAILTTAIDQSQIAGGLAAAAAKHIPVGSVAQYALPSPGGFKFDISARWDLVGKALGAWMVANSNGKAVVQPFIDKEFGSSIVFTNDLIAEIKQCSTCKVYPQSAFVASEVPTDLGTRVANVLTSEPDVTYVLGDYDAAAAFMVPAIKSAGLGGRIKLAAAEGAPQNLALIAHGDVQYADMGLDLYYAGWNGVYQLARLLGGLPLAVNPDTNNPYFKYSLDVPWVLLTKNNLPAAGKYYTANIGTAAKFEALMGVGK